jgi:DDE superfamily endonuclease
MALRSSGGRVEPAVRLALTIRMLAGAFYLDMMLVFRITSTTVYDAFHSTVASIRKRIEMPGLPVSRSNLHSLALAFIGSRQPPNPLYGCIGAVDGICIEIQKPLHEFGPRAFYCLKGMYAIPAQALVDANYRFLSLSAKVASSTPDGIAWESSSFGMRLRRMPLPAGFSIAGDAAYPCRNGVLPHRRPGSSFTTSFGSRGMHSIYFIPLCACTSNKRLGCLSRYLVFSGES